MAGQLKLALIVQAVDKATKPLRAIGKTAARVSRQTGLDRVAASAAAVGRRLGRVGGEMRGAIRRIATFAGTIGGLLGGFALRASGQMEQLRVAFESMLGGARKARDMVKRLTDFAARTPFQLQGIGASAKALLAFGETPAKIIPTLRNLGDIAAGSGNRLVEIVQIYGKAMAKGKVQTEELNQLSERGIPIVQALVDLAAKYGNTISKEDIYKAAERGEIKFENLREALESLTEKGGIFHKQMAKQSETLFGVFSTLKDNVFNVLAAIGDRLDEALGVKAGMKSLIAWLQNLQRESGNFKAFGAELRSIRDGLAGMAAGVGAWLKSVREAHPVVGRIADAIYAWAQEAGWIKIVLGAVALTLSAGLLKAVVALFGPLAKLTAAVALAAAKMGAMAVTGVAGAVLAFTRAVRAGTPVMAAFNKVLKANPILAIVSLVLTLAYAAWEIYDNWGDIAAWFGRIWESVKAAFAGLPEWFAENWKALAATFLLGIPGLIAKLLGFDLTGVGEQWIDGLWAGMKRKWTDIVAWLRRQVDELKSWLPGGWIGRQFGLEDAAGVSPPSEAPPRLFPGGRPRGLAGRGAAARVGGEVAIRIEDESGRARVKRVRSDNPDVPLDVTTGYNMAW